MLLSLSNVGLIYKHAPWTTRALNLENCYETEQARYLEDTNEIRVSSFKCRDASFFISDTHFGKISVSSTLGHSCLLST